MPSIVWRNAKVIVPIAVAQALLYFALNHYPLFAADTLTLTWLDDAMPFWSWTMWPYLAMIFAPILLPFFVRDTRVFRQAMWAYVPALGATLACHFCWPTRIERPAPAGDTFQSWAYGVMLQADAPHSCLPSGHIVGPAILCWAFWRDGHRLGPWLLALFPLMSLTILTTKQHYAWDLLAGYVVAGLGIGFSYWLASKMRPNSFDHR